MPPEMMEFEAVRAWCEYDEWTVFANRLNTAVWDGVRIPKGSQSTWFAENAPSLIDFVRSFESRTTQPMGPLRSLRVLLRSGHDIELRQIEYREEFGEEPFGWHWYWRMKPPGVSKTLIWCASWPNNRFLMAETTDTAAVTRAMTEAQQWLGEAEAARMEGGQG